MGGSNIFNILFVLGLAAVVHPIEGTPMRGVDQVFVPGAAIVLVPMMWTGRVIGRLEGSILLAGYGDYLWLMWPGG